MRNVIARGVAGVLGRIRRMGLMGNLGKIGYLIGFQIVLRIMVKVLVFRAVWGFRRRVAEGLPRDRRRVAERGI